MRYFVMEHINGDMPRRPQGYAAEVRETNDNKIDMGSLYGVDFNARDGLISGRLKLLMEKYMPKYKFAPVVFLDAKKQEQLDFWRFCPPFLAAGSYRAEYKNTGVVSHFCTGNKNAPKIFSVRSPKNIWSVVVHASVAESILRRGILGLKLTRLTEEN